MQSRRRHLLFSTVVALTMTMAAFDFPKAQEIGSARSGFDLARKICSECHAVRPAELYSPTANVPSFESIAAISGMTAIALKVALRSSHQTMPNLILSENETNDVIAYILSLGDR